LRHASEHDPDEAAERGADPVDPVDAEPRDQHRHVDGVLRQRVVVGIGEAAAAAAADEVGTDDAIAAGGKRARQAIEVAALPAQAVDAD